MHSARLAATCLLGVLGIAGAATAAGEPPVNGSFEASGPIAAWQSLPAGSRRIPGWTIAAGWVDVVGGYWQAYDGGNSLEVGTPGAATVEQTIATTPGRRYILRFAMAGNPDGPPRIKTLDVTAGSARARLTFDVLGHSRRAMGWHVESLPFTAASTATVIRFTRPDGGATAWWGPAIDGVSIGEETGDENSPAPRATAVATAPPPAPRAFAPAGADPYGGLWRATWGPRTWRVYVERHGNNLTGQTVDGDASFPTGSIAFHGQIGAQPIVLLGRCADDDAKGWHGAVLEWTAQTTFHLHVADCRAGDVVYTRWR